MIALLSLTTLIVATLLALAAATAFQWLLLRVSLRLMHPATAQHGTVRSNLARGTSQLARAVTPYRYLPK